MEKITYRELGDGLYELQLQNTGKYQILIPFVISQNGSGFMYRYQKAEGAVTKGKSVEDVVAELTLEFRDLNEGYFKNPKKKRELKTIFREVTST